MTSTEITIETDREFAVGGQEFILRVTNYGDVELCVAGFAYGQDDDGEWMQVDEVDHVIRLLGIPTPERTDDLLTLTITDEDIQAAREWRADYPRRIPS